MRKKTNIYKVDFYITCIFDFNLYFATDVLFCMQEKCDLFSVIYFPDFGFFIGFRFWLVYTRQFCVVLIQFFLGSDILFSFWPFPSLLNETWVNPSSSRLWHI